MTLERPATTDLRVGRYAIQDAFVGECPAPTCELSRETVKPFYAVFNPFEGSDDGHVTGLSEGKLTAGSDGYVLGTTSRQFHWNGNANLPYQVKPTDETVFEYAMDEVDSLGADATSAEAAAAELTETVDVDRRLALRLTVPPDPTAGDPTTVTATVRNLRDGPVDDVDVRLHLPPGVGAGRTRFDVGTLGPLESTAVNVTPTPDELPLTVEAQATSPDAGLAYRSAALGGDEAAGPDLSVGEPSATVGSGESVETTVTFEGVPGESASASASAPEGVSVSFDPPNGTVGPDGQFATTATLAADAGLQPGEYVVHATARGGASGAHVATVELAVAAAPAFEVDYEVRETTVAPGGTATVENAGTAAGEATLALRIDGADQETRTVELDPGETRTVEFAASFDGPGEQTVRVNDLPATTVTVEAEPGPTATGADGGGLGIPGFGVATGLAVLLAAALLARRRGGGAGS